MKRVLPRVFPLVAVALLALLAPSVLRAQNEAFIGTWKLNLEKSKITGAEPPKSQTRTVEGVGNALKFTYDGVAADGSPISYTFTSSLDGNPAPMTGSGIPGDADMITSKRLTPTTAEATLTKAGKVVYRTQTMVSKDGKTTTVTRKGNANGKAVNAAMVYDKQ